MTSLRENLSATSVGETGGPVPPPAPAGAGSIPFNPGQGHDPNQITQVNQGFGGQPGFGGQVVGPNGAAPIDDPNQTQPPIGAAQPPPDIQVGLTGEGFGTKIDMPSAGMAQGLNKEGLNTALNAIPFNQKAGRNKQGELVKSTRDLMTTELKKFYPGLAPEQYAHMLTGMDGQAKEVMGKRNAYGQTREGRFESRTVGMTEPQRNQARQQQAEQKQREDQHRAALQRAEARGIPIAPTWHGGPRQLGRKWKPPQGPQVPGY